MSSPPTKRQCLDKHHGTCGLQSTLFQYCKVKPSDSDKPSDSSDSGKPSYSEKPNSGKLSDLRKPNDSGNLSDSEEPTESVKFEPFEEEKCIKGEVFVEEYFSQ